jgi:hypothetical protein
MTIDSGVVVVKKQQWATTHGDGASARRSGGISRRALNLPWSSSRRGWTFDQLMERRRTFKGKPEEFPSSDSESDEYSDREEGGSPGNKIANKVPNKPDSIKDGESSYEIEEVRRI